jgi:hypothetical protein
MNRSLVALLVCAAPVAAQEKATAPTYLTNEELKTLFSKTLRVRIQGSRLTASEGTYQKDGTVIVQTPLGDQIGSWRIEDNKFCTFYARVGGGCRHLRKTGETTYKVYTPEGQPTTTWEIQK